MQPDFEAAAKHITADAVSAALTDLVNIASPTGREAGVANYLVERMRRSGLETDLQMVEEGRPNAVGHLRGRGDGLNLLFTGHMDTSYDGTEDHLGSGPGYKADAVRQGDWIWGFGARNMKSGLASALVAIEAIAKTGIRLAGDISFGGVVGEIEKAAIEQFQGQTYSGYGIGSKHLVTHGVTADCAILAEPTDLRIASANMGCMWLRLTLGGSVAHAANSSKPGVVNAITRMTELYGDLLQWASQYAEQTIFMGERPNVTFSAISGGVPWRLSRNPHSCSLYLDIRMVPGQTFEAVKRDLRGVLSAFAERTQSAPPSMHVYVTDPATVVADDAPVVAAIGRAQQQVMGSRPPSILRRPGADAVHFNAYDVPCICFGPGGRMYPGSRAATTHELGEHVHIDDMVTASRIYLATALDLCGRRVEGR
jgi:acetylornithine deacetylase/succinyl-diaminopimelate desuccinylase-like protein